MRMGAAPSFHGLEGREVLHSLLGQVRVVQPHVAVSRGGQVLSAVAVVRAQHLLEPPVESLHHAVGLWRLRPGMRDTQGFTQGIERMLPRGVLGFGGEMAVSERTTVVGKQGVDLEQRGLVQRVAEGFGRCRRLVALDGG